MGCLVKVSMYSRSIDIPRTLDARQSGAAALQLPTWVQKYTSLANAFSAESGAETIAVQYAASNSASLVSVKVVDARELSGEQFRIHH